MATNRMRLLLLLYHIMAVSGGIRGFWRRWSEGQKVYYYQYGEKKYYSSARGDCRKRDADLLVINSRAENDWIWRNRRTGKSYWIGFYYNYAFENPKYQWVDGANVGFRRFDNDPPDDEVFRYGYLHKEKNGRWSTEVKHKNCNPHAGRYVSIILLKNYFSMHM